MPPKKKRKSSKKPQELTELQKRLISAGISLLSLLVIVSLLMGYKSISGDMDTLKSSGNILSWFGSQNGEIINRVGGGA